MCCLRMSNVPLMYRSSLTQSYHKHSPILYYCRTNTSESGSSPITRSSVPSRSSPPTKTSCLQSANQWIGVMRCLYWPAGVWSESTAGQQRGTEKQTSHTPQQNWTWHCHLRGFGCQVWFFWPSKMVVYWEFAKSPTELLTHQCISMCLHSVKCARRTWKHTRKMVSKRDKKKKISTHVTEEPKTTHLVVSRSHSPFFNGSFSIVVVSRPVTQPPKASLSDCQLSWKLLRSVFSLLLLLQCIVGSAVRYSKYNCQAKHHEAFSKTNEPTNFCCILSVWTLAGNLRMPPGVENLKVTSILFCS